MIDRLKILALIYLIISLLSNVLTWGASMVPASPYLCSSVTTLRSNLSYLHLSHRFEFSILLLACCSLRCNYLSGIKSSFYSERWSSWSKESRSRISGCLFFVLLLSVLLNSSITCYDAPISSSCSIKAFSWSTPWSTLVSSSILLSFNSFSVSWAFLSLCLLM